MNAFPQGLSFLDGDGLGVKGREKHDLLGQPVLVLKESDRCDVFFGEVDLVILEQEVRQGEEPQERECQRQPEVRDEDDGVRPLFPSGNFFERFFHALRPASPGGIPGRILRQAP